MPDDFLRALEDDLGSGVVRAHDFDAPVLRRFLDSWPFVFGLRIDWDQIPGARALPPPPGRQSGSFTLREPATELRRFWATARQELGVSDSTAIFVFGDSLFDALLEMPADHFTTRLVDLLSIPQHTLVFPADSTWCFEYTFEDWATYGRR